MEKGKKKYTYTLGLIFGILAFFFGPIFAIIGLILNLSGKAKEQYNTKPGLICSIIALVLWILILVLGIFSMSYIKTSAKKGCCTNYGGYWESGYCRTITSSGSTKTIPESYYFDSTYNMCVG